MTFSKSAFSIVLAALVCTFVLPLASAQASRNQLVTFEAPGDLQNPATRDASLAKLDSLGVRAIRLVMYWKDVAPKSSSRTEPDFDTTDPAGYDFSRVDPVIDAAVARGWKVLLTVTGPVPLWATRDRKAGDYTSYPNADKFAQFMTAVGRHFKGKVTDYAVWNEPNHPAFLTPQFDSSHHAVSPLIYRTLFQAAQKGLKSAGVSHPTLLFGETAPYGTGNEVAPLTFLRGALCLDASYKKTDAKCSKLDISGYAHHPYARKTGPFDPTVGANNVTIGTIGRLIKALDRAAAAGAIPARTPVYLTEFGVQSTPDTTVGVPFQQQAEFRAIGERLAYENPRVASFSQYLLTDDAPHPGVGQQRYSGFESGLISSAGKEKPSFDAFRLALAARKHGSTASVWGLVRPATAPGTATLQYRASSGGAFKTLKTVAFNRLGYFTVSVGYKKGRQYRLRWTAPDGTVYAGGDTRAYDK